MARIVETTVYKFGELSDDAKETARQWWRNCENADSDASHIYDDAANIAYLFGLDIRDTRSPTIYYSGFSSQGDGACFEGTYQYKKGGLAAVRAYAPLDTDLHQIVEALQTIQRRHFYGLTATTEHRGHYCHSGCMSVDVVGAPNCYCGDFTPAEESVKDALRAFAGWIYSRLEKEHEWRMADEQVDESIKCNGYEFTADGEPV